jgi:L-threonylcarbamoyladenylate synthase
LTGYASHWQLHAAPRWVAAGGVIAYPTEAVFGLGCDPGDRHAVECLLALKRRPAAKGLILIASGWNQLQPWLDRLLPAWHDRLRSSWPGPTTWLIPAAKHCPHWLTGRHSTLAVRITAHPPARRLCQALDSAIVSTSANRSGQRPARAALEVRLRFGCQIDFVLPGRVGTLTRPTEIRDLASGTVVRN